MQQGGTGEQHAGIRAVPRVGDEGRRVLGREDGVGEVDRQPLPPFAPHRATEIRQQVGQIVAALRVHAGRCPAKPDSRRIVSIGMSDPVILGPDRQDVGCIGGRQFRASLSWHDQAANRDQQSGPGGPEAPPEHYGFRYNGGVAADGRRDHSCDFTILQAGHGCSARAWAAPVSENTQSRIPYGNTVNSRPTLRKIFVLICLCMKSIAHGRY